MTWTWRNDRDTKRIQATEIYYPPTPIDYPMPGTMIDGATVVASVWYREADAEVPFDLVTVLRLHAATPYFSVGVYNLTLGSWDGEVYWTFRNIVPAVECYKDMGGDY